MLLLVVLLFAHSACCGARVTPSAESRLATKLLANYSPEMRPFNYGNRTLVKVGMTLSQIISLKEKSQELTTSVYMTYQWSDASFTWNPDSFENIHILRLPAHVVWKPRIILQNSKDGDFDVSLLTNVLIKYNGELEWIPPALYKSTCTINVALFPFDWQNCSMVFRSATYDRSHMELGFAYGEEVFVDRNAFQSNGEWDLIQKPISIYNSNDDPLYQDMTFYFIMKRRPQFYVMNLIVPAVLLTSLSCLVFYLPSISCEKMTLSISILIGETVFLFLVAQKMPETSFAVPLIGSYMLFCTTLVILSVVFSVIVCNVHFRSKHTHSMPNWVTYLFMDKLASFLNMERPSAVKQTFRIRRRSSVDAQKAIVIESSQRPSSILYNNQVERLLGGRIRRRNAPLDFGVVGTEGELNDMPCTIKPNIKNIAEPLKPTLKTICYIAKYLKTEDNLSQSQDDWAYVALILDRLLLWVYLTTFTLGTLAFFLQATMADYPT
ncbi:acetylcholine receptor subunit beta-like [Clavelina lepadiformis]|uniref:acetylcholine receptor subunit beta-like n=1 Tax=Clavelina lepadiformis TaxID=159417 RepID=UPI004042C30D